ncbi:MAG: branched-chain amino acid aminotransferase [Clostridia bacterium]|nr:branched-chain amino acid aminotransferase [Clostridia bacterium]MDD6040222.1 branched-chain amino acid aminotransferase [Clostridia bacterium]
MLNIRIEKTTCPKAKPTDETALGFGRIFTDHMAIIDWNTQEGWHDARIVPFENFSMHPAATCLHYGSEIFEGLKAYRRADGGIQLFRPDCNARRMMESAERLCLPQLPEEDFLQILKAFVQVEADWTPHSPGTSLYLRPFLYGNDETLGVHAVHNARFAIIASPVGSYYKEGINPVGIMIEDQDVRAVRGGTGYAKCGGNYAASNRAGERAAQKGYSQVLWLDGVHRKYIEEVGAMNVMFKINGEIITPALTGSILPGVTRRSCIEVLQSKGYQVSERLLSIDELARALEDGTLEEAWGCGTAAVVSPIGKLAYKDQEYIVSGGKIGEVTQMLYDTLTGIQWSRIDDPFGWVVPVC